MTSNNQHIPSGYKPSPLGIIPEDWEVKRLGELGNFSKGNGVPKDKIIKDANEHPCLTYGDLYTKYDFVIKDIKSFIDDDVASESKEIHIGDICFAGSGETPEDIGKCAAYIEERTAYAGGDIITLAPNKDINSIWLSYALNSDIGGKQRYKFAQGFSIVHIYPDYLKQIQIPTPTYTEQNSIVSVLSLWDTAISKQSALIEKLTQRKRGLMQQLLTGKKRLKGFVGNSFKMMSFDKIANTVNVKAFQVSKSDYQEKGKTPIVDQGQMFIAAYSDSNKVFADVPFILFGDHTRIIKWIDFPCVIGADGVQAIKAKGRMDIKYLYYLLSNTELPNLGYSRHMSILKEKVFYVSTNLDEQKAIAECLSRADNEIEIQKQKLASLQEQKKGLMQVLLTGKRRVK